MHKAEADDASDDEAEDDASSFDSASVFSPVGITSRAPSDLVLKDGVLLFPQPDGLAWTNAYCILRSNRCVHRCLKRLVPSVDERCCGM